MRLQEPQLWGAQDRKPSTRGDDLLYASGFLLSRRAWGLRPHKPQTREQRGQRAPAGGRAGPTPSCGLPFPEDSSPKATALL